MQHESDMRSQAAYALVRQEVSIEICADMLRYRDSALHLARLAGNQH